MAPLELISEQKVRIWKTTIRNEKTMSSFWETNTKQIHHKMSCKFFFGSSLSFLSVERKKVKGLFPLYLASSKDL